MPHEPKQSTSSPSPTAIRTVGAAKPVNSQGTAPAAKTAKSGLVKDAAKVAATERYQAAEPAAGAMNIGMESAATITRVTVAADASKVKAAGKPNMALKTGTEPAAVASNATNEPIASEAQVAVISGNVALSDPNSVLLAPAPPGLADLLDTINSLSCDVRRLGKAATRAALELGERLAALFDYAPHGEWSDLVGKTAVNVPDAASLISFAEGRHGLIERLSPVYDVPLRKILDHLAALGNALALTAGNPQQMHFGAKRDEDQGVNRDGGVANSEPA